MSIRIKGFPMPNNCGACPLRLAWCRERIYMVDRPERCPLVDERSSEMSKYSSGEITKLLGILIGSTEPIGESNYDEKVLENLKTLIDVTNWCLDGVAYARDYIGRVEWSMNKVGFDAQCALQEWEKWIKERIGE